MLVFALFASACTGGSGLAATSWPGITTDGETLYLAFGSHVYAINASNGGEIWRFPEEADRNISFYATPILGGDGQLIVGGYNNVLYSIDPENGNQIYWTFNEARNRYIGSPIVTAELALAPSADSNLYALNFSGEALWKFTTREPSWGQPAVDENNVYVASLDHHLYAINLETGRVVWDKDLRGAIVGTPLVVNGVVYSSSFAKTLTAHDTRTGEVLWTFPTNNWVWAGAAMEEGILYFGDIDGILYAVNAHSREEKWSFQADGGIFSTPLIADGKIYFTTENGSIYAFTVENEQLWSQKIVGKIYTSPILVNNLVLVAAMESDKLIIAYDENGIERWSYTPTE